MSQDSQTKNVTTRDLLLAHLRKDQWREALDVWRLEMQSDDIKLQRSKIQTDAVLSFGNLAIKSLLLLNGGSSIALLAHVGYTYEYRSHYPGEIESLLSALMSFSVGAFFGAFCAGLSYVAQYSYHRVQQLEAENPASRAESWRCIATAGHVGVVLFAIAGYVLFLTGVQLATSGL